MKKRYLLKDDSGLFHYTTTYSGYTFQLRLEECMLKEETITIGDKSYAVVQEIKEI